MTLVRRMLAALRSPAPDERGTLAWESIYPAPSSGTIMPPVVAPRPVRAVTAATVAVTLALANPLRRALSIVNDSTATLYVKHGPGAAPIAGGYTAIIGPAGTYILQPPDTYQGELSGVWTAANGAASITETR